MSEQTPNLRDATINSGTPGSGCHSFLGVKTVAKETARTETAISSVHDLHEQRYAGEVKRAALLLRSPGLAHDVVADAFCQVINRWQTIEDPAAYLSRCVLNGCRSASKKQQREQPSLEPEQEAVSESGYLAEYDEMSDAIANLPWKQRAVVVLKYYEELTETEIAEELGIRSGSVGPTLARAKKRLAKEVGE